MNDFAYSAPMVSSYGPESYYQKTKLLKESMFSLAYMIFMATVFLNGSFYAIYIFDVYKIIFYLCIVLLVVKELLSTSYSKKAIFGGFLIILLMGIIKSYGGVLQMGTTLILIFCSRDIPIKKLVRVSIFICVLMSLFIVISSQIGIINDYVFEDEKRTRHCLGFLYCLTLPTKFFNIIVLEIYLHKEKISNLKLLVFAFINYFIYTQCVGRLAFGCTMLLILMTFIMKYRPFIRKMRRLRILMSNSWWICCIISFVVTLSYNANVGWMYAFNDVSGGRLSLGQLSLLEYGVRLFGNPGLEWVGNGLNMKGQQSVGTYLWVDNFYISIAQRFGIIYLLVYMLVLTKFNYKSNKLKDYYLLMLLSLQSAFSLIQESMLGLTSNSLLLLIGPILLSRKYSDTVVRVSDDGT